MAADAPGSSPRADARLAALRAELASIGPVREIEVPLPWSGQSYRLVQPTDLDALIEAVIGDPEENLPHWAELWPSGIALADVILQSPEMVAGRRCLELGCGLGTTAIAACSAGADLLVVDYAPEALALTRYHCCLNGRSEPQAEQLNWRRPSAAFLAGAGAGFPVVLAADVLYETRDIYPLVRLVERIVAPSGLLWLAEPGRGVARRFVEILEERGWTTERRTHPGPWPDPRDHDVVVNLVQLRRPLSTVKNG